MMLIVKQISLLIFNKFIITKNIIFSNYFVTLVIDNMVNKFFSKNVRLSKHSKALAK